MSVYGETSVALSSEAPLRPSKHGCGLGPGLILTPSVCLALGLGGVKQCKLQYGAKEPVLIGPLDVLP